MTDIAYKKLKRQNGEKFAQTLRNHHSGLLEIPEIDVILRYAGQDAAPLLPYLMSLLAVDDNTTPPASRDPFVLFDQAGYKAFYADTLKKQNSIRHYFQPDELLCTFNDAARYQDYHIVHALRKDVDQIKRRNFRGCEQREDAYGTSVISIQMLKTGGFISIKNRYNHVVNSPDNTFNSNPDKITNGLSVALKQHFNVEFSAGKADLPSYFVLMGKQIFKWHEEHNNIYYGDQAWAQNGEIHTVNRAAGDALFDCFLFNNKSKTLEKIGSYYKTERFDYDFNRYYGGNRALCVQNGSLTLNGTILIGAERSRIKTLHLPAFTCISENCLISAPALTDFDAAALVLMSGNNLKNVPNLRNLNIPMLTTMGENCLSDASALTHVHGPMLTTIDKGCFKLASALAHVKAPFLTDIGKYCFLFSPALNKFKPSIKAALKAGKKPENVQMPRSSFRAPPAELAVLEL